LPVEVGQWSVTGEEGVLQIEAVSPHSIGEPDQIPCGEVVSGMVEVDDADAALRVPQQVAWREVDVT
jgi:hypothetical protein